jgi:hypothetical protein
MMMLGELMKSAYDSLEVAAMLVEAQEIALLVRLDGFAAAKATDRGEIARDAMRAFTDAADNEAWVKLMGRVQDESSPAAACLAEMVAWSLARAQA